MPRPLLRRASALALVGVLATTLGAGASSARADTRDALLVAATATRVVSSSVRCTGDSTSAPAASRLIRYWSIAASTFAKREASAGGKVLNIGSGILSLRDFQTHAATWDGADVGDGSTGLVGAGIGSTTVRLTPHSSTRQHDIPSTFPATNQLSVLRLIGSATVLRGFTLLATAQGHLYNGIRVEKVENLRADHVRVVGVPGDDNQPPGETFAINDYRTLGSRWSHIRIDGKGVGASGFATNGSTDIRICDAVSKNNPSAMGFAFWQSSGITCIDCRAYDNGFSGFNFERTSGAVSLVRPVATGNKYDMRIASDRSSARFTIRDPELVSGHWTIWLPKRWYGAANKQKRSDVTLIVHGKQRNDLLRFRTY